MHVQTRINGFADLKEAQTRVIYDAKELFSSSEKGSSAVWNCLIRSSSMVGLFELSLLVYLKMFYCSVAPDKQTFLGVLKACVGLRSPELGKLVHGTVRLMGMESDPYLGSALIKLYAENDCLDYARETFDEIPERDCIVWNVMIDGYARNKNYSEAFVLFDEMRRFGSPPNYATLSCILSICATEGKLSHGEQIHDLAIKCGMNQESSVGNTLLTMYSKCKCWNQMTKLFDEMSTRCCDLIAWNCMIGGYAQNGFEEEAIDLLHKMQLSKLKPDSITLATVIPLFSARSDLKKGEETHAFIIRNGIALDLFLKSALIDLYFKCREVETAEKVFILTESVDVVIYSAVISGYILNGLCSAAMAAFDALLAVGIKPNAITIASILPACSNLGALKIGRELHCYSLKKGIQDQCFVSSALMDMYAKCGRLELAHNLFERIHHRDSISWNSMISSFSQNGQPEIAIELFRRMGMEGFDYDCTSISSVLSACANVSALHHGREIHAYMLRTGSSTSDIFTESALVDMYAKSGKLIIARQVFNGMQKKNEVSWNSIIAAYGSHGHILQASVLFQSMIKAGSKPDHVTFLSLLSACAHAGMIAMGLEFFRQMAEEFTINPRMEHYACMVDLLGRAGRLDDAFDLIKNMPFSADSGVWGALLGACRVHGAFELAEIASQKLLLLDPQNSGYYVIMANVHALAGRWEGAGKMRMLMKERNVSKPPGCSWIEVAGGTHVFIAADPGHPESPMIYFLLKFLLLQLTEEGYVPSMEMNKEKNGVYFTVENMEIFGD